SYEDLWNPVGEVAPPIDPKQLKAPRDLQPVRPDFLNWAIDVPSPDTSSSSPRPPAEPRRAGREPAPWDAAPAPEDNWAQGRPRPRPPPPEVIPGPSPRRPVWVSNEPEGPWAAEPAATPPAAPEAAANALAAAQAFAAISASPTSVSATGAAAMADFVRLF